MFSNIRQILKTKLHRFLKTELFAAFSTTSLTTGISMITGLVINKVVAITIGPSGIAFVGQFGSFKTLATNMASGSFGSGVTKYVADSDYSTQRVIATSNIFSLCISVALGLIIIVFSQQLSTFLLKNAEYYFVFIIFGLLLPLFSLNNLLHATVNGFRNFKALAYLKITNNIIGLILSASLVLSLQLTGALLAQAINTSIVFIISLIILYYYFSLSQFLSFDLKKFDKSLLKKLLAFTLMALTSAQLKPFVRLYIRSYIIENGSEFDAGIWQAMVSLSGHYLAVITTALSVYYLPKLSSLKITRELRNEIFFGYKVIIPIFLLMAIIVYFSRNWIIVILYSKEFLVMSPLFFPQLVGDFFMIFSFLIAYMLMAKAMIKLFMISQIVFAITRITFSIFLFNQIGIVGVIWANAINYFLYSIFLLVAFRKIILLRN